jgi:hypothetical protein
MVTRVGEGAKVANAHAPDDVQFLPYLATRFDRVEPAGGLDITRLGTTFYRYEIYVGRGFKPAP